MGNFSTVLIIIIMVFVAAAAYLMINVDDITESVSFLEESGNCTEYDIKTEVCYENLEGPGELICPIGKHPGDINDVEGCRQVDRCCDYKINRTLFD